MFHSKKVYTWHTAGQNFFDSLIDPHQNIGHWKDSYSRLLRGFISRDHKPCRLKWTNDPEETTGYNSMNQSWGGNILDMACLWMILLNKTNKTNKKYDLNRHCVNICQRGSSEIIQNSTSSCTKLEKTSPNLFVNLFPTYNNWTKPIPYHFRHAWKIYTKLKPSNKPLENYHQSQKSSSWTGRGFHNMFIISSIFLGKL